MNTCKIGHIYKSGMKFLDQEGFLWSREVCAECRRSTFFPEDAYIRKYGSSVLPPGVQLEQLTLLNEHKKKLSTPMPHMVQ